MQVRDFLEHEWLLVGAVQERLLRAGIPIAEVKLLALLRSMQGVLVSEDGRFCRLVPS